MKVNTFLKNIDYLKKQYPNWNAPVVTLIAVHSNDPFLVLISTILSLRTKDEVTSKASIRLFNKANTPQKISNLSVEDIKKLIYPVGFYNRKAQQIIDISREIILNHKGIVPNTLDDLLKFKGVGRKTANLVLSLGYNIPAICVDTHVHRISNRWGIIKTSNPQKTEFALMEKIPQKYWITINDLLVAFGQTICRPIGPKCNQCAVVDCLTRKD